MNKKFTRLIRTPSGVAINIAISFLSIIPCLLIGNVYAGGWTQKAGSGIYIQSFSYSYATDFFSDSGKKTPLNGYYKKYEINPYIEYGVRDWLTIGSNIFLQSAVQNDANTNITQTNYGIGDSEFFVRTRIWHNNNFSFALEPMVKFPSITSAAAQPQIGSKNFDAGFTFSSGYAFKAWRQNHFINLDTGYRKRFGIPNDQFKFAATAGFSLSPKWVVMPQFFVTSRLKNQPQSIFTQSSGDDYNLAKLQLSAIYKVTEKFYVQAGVFGNLAGQNAGDGKGMMFSIQKVF